MLKSENDNFERNKTSFFSAVTGISGGNIERDLSFYEEHSKGYKWINRPVPKPYRNLLLTPIAISKKSKFFNYIKHKKEQEEVNNVIFDSGGFQLLTGSLESKGITSLDHLEQRNLELYHKHDWASLYMMPDYPPNKQDSYHLDFNTKVNQTIEHTLSFYDKLSIDLKEKSVPVFHLRTIEDIEKQYNCYKSILDKSGYASFSASALTEPKGHRKLKGSVLVVLSELQRFLSDKNINLHCLGIGSPSAMFMLNYLGVRSVDSSTPFVVSGLGQVVFPYVNNRPCSTLRNNYDNMNEEQLEYLKRKTGHSCPFCTNLLSIKQHYEKTDPSTRLGHLWRRMHNLVVMDELNWLYRDLNLELFENLSPNSYNELLKVCDDKQVNLLSFL